jgi:hypothetical protein
MFYTQIQKHIKDVEATIDTAFAFRLKSDVNAVGGALLEQELTFALTDDKYVCLTNRMVETLDRAGQHFIFPEDMSLSEVMKKTKEMDNDFYATDLFLFERPSDNEWMYIDSISVKTSLSDNNGVMVNLVNDANGEVIEALENGGDVYLGQTLLILLNMKKGDYEVVWVDGTIQELVGGSEYEIRERDGSFVFQNWTFPFADDSNRNVMIVTNRSKSANMRSASSFNRGVKIRKDMIHNFGETFSSGHVEVDDIRFEVVQSLLHL